MITQCPACSTLFRVVPDQLRISEGWVRCGQCGEVFDASMHLLQEPLPEASPGAAAAAVASAPTPGGPAGELDTAAAPLEPADEDELPPAPGSVDVLLEDLGTPLHRTKSAGQAVPSVPPIPAETPAATSPSPTTPVPGPTEATATAPGSTVTPDAPAGKPQILRTRSGQPLSGSAPDADAPPAVDAVAPQSPGAAAATATAPEPTPAPEPGPTLEPMPEAASGEEASASSTPSGEPAWYAQYKRGFDKAPDETDGAEFAADTLDELTFVRHARRRAFWDSIATRAVLGLVALVLVLLLAAQVAVHLRDRLAAMYPPLKPALEQLCRPFGCALQPLRQIDAVVIDSSTFNRLGPEAFRLSLTLRNQSGLDVAMPWLELTLTDTGEQPLVRRVLSPEELGAPSATVLGARSEWSAAVDLVLPGEGAGGAARVAGYRLLAFYP